MKEADMTDDEILELYFARDESAIAATAKRFGAYCMSISFNILRTTQDAEECVNDTYLNAWRSIPPSRPASLAAFLGRITRNLALDRVKANKAQKRGGGETPLILSELEQCIPSGINIEGEIEDGLLAETIDRFLDTLKKDVRIFFVRRYWYSESIPCIAGHMGVSAGKVKASLCRTRKAMKKYLIKQGVTV